MKYPAILLILPIILFATCHKKPTPEKIIQPVKMIEVGNFTLLNQVFPGYAEAEEYVYLNFRVNGMLQALTVDEGRDVKKGELIASLDTRDYDLNLSSAKAAYQQAKSQMERYERLYARNAVSKQEYEMSQAAYENSKSVYNKASNDILYTRLTAPFNGNIEKKYVENHQQVVAGQQIVKLINPDKIQYRFILPEADIHQVTRTTKFSIELDVERGKYYQATIKDMVTSSVGGSGVPIILKIDDPKFNSKDIRVLPGYACNIRIEQGGSLQQQTISIPISAIYDNTQAKQKGVWKVNVPDSSVHFTPVTVGEMVGEKDIIIQSGLNRGDKIVTAGVTLLSEGEKVKILNDK